MINIQNLTFVPQTLVMAPTATMSDLHFAMQTPPSASGIVVHMTKLEWLSGIMTHLSNDKTVTEEYVLIYDIHFWLTTKSKI